MGDTKILLAEDDINLGSILREYLNAKGFETHLFENGVLALEAFMADKFTLCIFDIMMPEMDGLTLAREVRQVDSKIPIIFLTAKGVEEDILEGFRTGADDYITKPFSIEELVYRIKAIEKRTEIGAEMKDFEVFQLGMYTFDYLKRTLSIEGETVVKLTTKEAELLSLLCRRHNEILERNYALKYVWTSDNYFNARSMDVYITRLRKYFKDDPSVKILNVHGKGYKLVT
jgi:two-component system OmpR family response regulator